MNNGAAAPIHIRFQPRGPGGLRENCVEPDELERRVDADKCHEVDERFEIVQRGVWPRYFDVREVREKGEDRGVGEAFAKEWPVRFCRPEETHGADVERVEQAYTAATPRAETMTPGVNPGT